VAYERVRRRVLVLSGVAFLASGAAALVYQVVWQRLLAFHTGVGITSIALIVAAFMAGLGLGSQLGGTWSARVSARAALRLFAVIEILVGLFALASVPLYYDRLDRWAGALYQTTAGSALAHFLALLPPTFLMGMSLPFLVRALVHDAATASRTIGVLYGINVVGAALGALVTPWFLIRFFGIEGAVLWGVGANAVAGLTALLAGAFAAAPAVDPAAAGAREPDAIAFPLDPGQGRLALWVGLYALSGFIALCLEMVWFRIVDVAVKSMAFTFGTVLCLYLLGLGAGSLVGGRLAPRWTHPLRTFVSFQCALLGWAALAVALLARLPPSLPLYSWFVDYWRGDTFFHLGADWNPGMLGKLYLVLPIFLYGPPTFLMGLSFTALQRAVQDDPRTSGRKVGLLQAANIVGCVAGSLLGGLVLLEHLGTAGTLRALVVAGGVAFLGVRLAREGRRPATLAWAGLLAASVLALPSGDVLWTRLHGEVARQRPSFVGEDATAVSAITPGMAGHWRVTVGGLPHSWIPYEGIHTLLGAVPALVHPSPEEVAVVGLGSGETAWAAGCRRETRSIDVFEIAGAEPGLLRGLAESPAFEPPPGVPRGRSAFETFLRDGRVHVHIADGRHALLRSQRRFDLIQVDALFRTSAGSGNLYSVEFFRLCARRLKPRGIVSSQVPSRRAALTFAAAIPHVVNFGTLIVGSNDPFPIDVETWVARARSPEVTAYLGSRVVEGIVDRLEEAGPARSNPDTRLGLNFDLFPRDEFSTPAGYR
jgi:spermidine synthase